MSVATNQFITLQINRTRGKDLTRPWAYWFFSGAVVGDGTGGSAVIAAFVPNLAAELFITLDRYSWKVLAVNQTPNLYIPSPAPLEQIPAGDGDTIDAVDQGASLLYHASPGMTPKYLGKISIAAGNSAALLVCSLGNNAAGVTGQLHLAGRLFDVEPMGAM